MDIFPTGTEHKYLVLEVKVRKIATTTKKLTMDYLPVIYYSSSTNFSTNMIIPSQNS